MRRTLLLHNLLLTGVLVAAASTVALARLAPALAGGVLAVAALTVPLLLRRPAADRLAPADGLRLAGGWRCVQGVDAGGVVLDHVLVGPGGLLAVDLRSRRGRLTAAAVPPEWIAHARAHARALAGATGRPADALLVLRDAHLDRVVSTQRGVTVVAASMLAHHLDRRRPTLADEEVEALVQSLSEGSPAGVSGPRTG